MGDLHAEGVTSMELLSQPREPLPGLDALYFLKPEPSNLDLVLADFKSAAAAQHRQVHFCFTQPLPAELLARLSEAQHLALRVRSFVEVPLSFVLVQDRGFHFDMPEALPGLFPVPDPKLTAGVVQRLVDVCRCLQATTPSVRHAQSDLCQSVAEQVLSELALHKPLSQQLQGPPCQLLIVDRSIDIAATLVHEYSYEASVYDLLDGNMLDADRSVITLKGPPAREVLLSDNDPLWEELKHEHLEGVQALVDQRVEEVKRQNVTRDAGSMSTSDLLEMVRRSPEQRDAVDRLFLHLSMVEQVFKRIGEERLMIDLGVLEQDIACGVDKNGKDVKASNLQSALTRAFNEPLSSESKLRVLMLYFACVANISEVVRSKIIEMARLDPEDQQVLMAMLRTRLMEVPEAQRKHVGNGGASHRVTKEQAARFKKNALAEGRFELSRFEPRIKAVLEQLAEHRLSKEDFPVAGADNAAGMSLRHAAAETHGAPAIQATDDWSFATPGAGPGTSPNAPPEVTQRVIIFVLGGFTHSELRAAAEVEHKMPRGTEVLIGGTSLLTPRRLIRALRPQRSGSDGIPGAEGGDPTDLT